MIAVHCPEQCEPAGGAAIDGTIGAGGGIGVVYCGVGKCVDAQDDYF